jgi:dihydroorotate dehydrogenase (fumarate)
MIDLSKTIDLSTTYVGLKLKNPLVASSSPMCEDLGSVRRMEDAGAAAIVLQSLFEEQIEVESGELDRFLGDAAERSPEAFSHFPELTHRVEGPDAYLEHIQKCKRAIKIPIIASLNGTTLGGWIRYARQMEEAGADALELNIYYIPVDPQVTGEQVEQQYVDLVKALKAEVRIPLALKLGPYFSAMAKS